MPTNEGTGTVDPVLERFHLLVNAPALVNALTTALELDLFITLFGRPATFEDLQAETGLPPHSLRVLLHAVCTTGLLVRRDGRYANSAVADDLLTATGPESWRNILTGWREVYYPAFTHLTEALKTGTNTALSAYPGDEPTLYQRLPYQPRLEAVFHRAMTAFTLRTIDALVDSGQFTAVRRLLDVGGGDGTTSVRLAARHPELTSTVFDIPSVSRLAGQATVVGFEDRITLHPGDLFTDPFPQGHDTVLFSHVLEVFSGDQITTLLRKACEILPTGGRVLIYGFNASDDETEGWYSARLSLYLNALASGQGMAYPACDYEAWLRQAGFGQIRTLRNLPYEHGLHIGVKP
ncbi:methyltransferase [Streptomyces sp. NPDC021093]|uniref:methyltransferase n=1 Tax=Streptomyces sp. NPDC021093 TaxID=3365112 RepID=UPI0037A764B1